ncbi:nucleoside-diphosphate kinase [Kribbella sp. NBC_01505]|uniref:nucleoside-diphosphate kinase n=1 Tax=Kribbella sp. NBC_01505 TaxID=2903580 RepID=UPI0038680B2D
MDWTRWSVILLKPDCIRRGLINDVLDRIQRHVLVLAQRQVVVEDWQIFIHYWDMLVNKDWFPDRDIVRCLRDNYVGQEVVVALAHGPEGADTPALVRSLLGHFDPTQAAPGTIRADLGADSLSLATSQARLIDNLVHASDDATAACRDFGTWYGANAWSLLDVGGN